MSEGNQRDMNNYPDDNSEDEVFLSEASEAEEDAGTEGDYEFRGEESEDEGAYENALEQGVSLGSSPAATPDAFVDVAGILARAAAAADQGDAPVAAAAPAAPAAQPEQRPLIDVADIFRRAIEAAEEPAASTAAAPPRGLPGLPARPKPKGGPTLPPRAGLGLGGGLPPRQPPTEQQPAASAPAAAPAAPAAAPAAAAPTAAAQPAGGPSLPPRPAQPPAMFRPAPAAAAAAEEEAAAAAAEQPAVEEPRKVREVKRKVQGFRTDIYRVALRLQYPTRSTMIQQLMYRLGMAERIHLNQPGTLAARNVEEQAQADAERAEVLHEPLNFSCTIMVLGLSGAGKTATVYSLLGKELPAGYKETKKVDIIRGEIEGISVTFIDTPGLEPSTAAISSNLRKLHAAKRAFNRYKPQCVLYVDRLDLGRRDQADLQVARSITDVFGPDMWFSTNIVLTHATTPPPENSQGQTLAFDVYVQQRQQQVQQVLRQVTQDGRLMNPVALAENSPTCPRNERGQPVLPTGTEWRRQMLMLSFVTKTLTDSNNVLKPGDGAAAAQRAINPYGMMGVKIPPIGWLLSRLIDFRGPRKYPEEEREFKMDDEIDKLPPTEKQTQIRKKRAYIRQKAEEARSPDSSTPVPAPAPELPPSFDHDVGDFKYKVLDDPSGLIVRPVVGGEGGVDHDDGIDTVIAEKQAVLRKRGRYLGGVPAVGWVQVQKDKNQLSFQGEVEGSKYHSSKWVSTSGLNVQSVGRDILYTWRADSRYKTSRRNKAAVGAIVAKLGEDYSHPFKGGAIAYGLKVDERLKVAGNAKLRGSLGRMYTRAGGQYDHATGLAVDLRVKPSFDESMRVLVGGTAAWQRRDTTYGGNFSTEFRLPKKGGRGGKSDTTVALNGQYTNKGSGNVVVRVNSHDYPMLAASMAVPLLRALWDKLFGKEEF